MQRLHLQGRVVLATLAVLAVVVGLTGGLFLYMLRQALIAQIGEDALDVARSVARSPSIAEAVQEGDPHGIIQETAERIRTATGADFVVVGDRYGYRLSHPDPALLGQLMVGGDNGPALAEGREYVSFATGTLGPSMRGKVPILDDQGRVIGIVSVGYLVKEVDRVVWGYAARVGVVSLAGLGIGSVGAVALARSIKRATQGLEPEEIAAMAGQQRAILEAIREGIIAIDKEGRVIVANETARVILPGLEPGVTVRSILPNSRLPEVLHTGQAEFDQPMLLGDTLIVTNRVPIRQDGEVVGVVSSFRDRTELERLTQELSETRRYTEELRAQAHEFANTLQVISGMLQLGKAEEAVDFIQDVSAEYRQLLDALPRSIGEPAVAALILGKRARAEELHGHFTLDPESYIAGPVPDPSLLIRVVGNLVDNALEAVAEQPGDRLVRLLLLEGNGQIRIEVADNGPGVPPDMADAIFTEGVSTKGPGRGIGLALLKRLVVQAGGQITLGTAPEGGALFRVLLPPPKEV